MGEAKRRGTLEQRRAEAKADLITKGYMKIGMNYDKGPSGELRGWWVYPDPAPDREPVRIVRGH